MRERADKFHGRRADTELELIRLSLSREPGDITPPAGAAGIGRVWPETLSPAAVLVPLFERGDRLHVILTVRAEGLTRHPGQIAFPGGRVENGDTGALDAALRESQEEIGLPPGLVEPLGYLDTCATVSGYAVVPVVACVCGAFDRRPDPLEVTGIFDAPLDHLLDPAHRRQSARRIGGIDVPVYEILFEGRRIWGATAAMLVDLSRRVAKARRRRRD